MLNTDIELIADIDVSATEGTVCTVSADADTTTCTEATTKTLVEEYATVKYPIIAFYFILFSFFDTKS